MPAMDQGHHAQGERRAKPLGKGRSAVVYACTDHAGRQVARKVFCGADRAADVVNYVLTGAPNPYRWCEDAIRCAQVRRQIMCDLTQWWFGNRLRVSQAWASRWNAQQRSFELDTDFISGRHALLRHPFVPRGLDEMRDLRDQILTPLRKHLMCAGLDGLVWQAGRGNPAGLGNFLRRTDGDHGWVWIDLESGVPALAPINPVDLLVWYLPKSFRHRRPLFDDVDIDKLRDYLRANEDELTHALGEPRVAALMTNISTLEHHQRQWRSLSRVARSLKYRLCHGDITRQQADWYRTRPVRWHGREMGRGMLAGVRFAGRKTMSLARLIARVRPIRAVGACWRFMTSQTFRAALSRKYIAQRIDSWQQRGQLSAGHATRLRDYLDHEDTGSYLTDFGVHIAIKPFIKFTVWVIIPALLAAGVLPAVWAVTMIVFGGMIGRSLYTGGRSIQALLQGHRTPWIALLVGLMPVVGNLAYPAQIAYRGSEREGKLAGFIMYDALSAIGAAVPIWGGRDTATEHWFNRVVTLIVQRSHVVSEEPAVQSSPQGK